MTRSAAIPLFFALATLALGGCAHAPASGSGSAETAVVSVDVPAVAEESAAPENDAVPAADEASPPIALEPDDALPDVSSDTASVAQDAPAESDPRTDAEREYDELYGVQSDDEGLPTPAEIAEVYDPWEGFNRRMHAFNDVVDRVIAKPLAKFYMAVLPRPVRLGVGNFFSNLGQPLTALNSVLQGKPKQAAQAIGRFALNATLGIGGVFDPATEAGIPNKNEDFGQTLGVWGWKQSRYLELPLFGPRTVRDVFGLVGDGQLSPIRQVEDDPTRVFLQGLQLVDVRTQLFAVDSMREGAADDYALVRDAWLQRRRYQIFGDRKQQDAELPEYLREDTANPSVPADAMPIMPSGGK
jgi:phospholipid-binding lipoprotein MlaA